MTGSRMICGRGSKSSNTGKLLSSSGLAQPHPRPPTPPSSCTALQPCTSAPAARWGRRSGGGRPPPPPGCPGRGRAGAAPGPRLRVGGRRRQGQGNGQPVCRRADCKRESCQPMNPAVRHAQHRRQPATGSTGSPAEQPPAPTCGFERVLGGAAGAAAGGHAGPGRQAAAHGLDGAGLLLQALPAGGRRALVPHLRQPEAHQLGVAAGAPHQVGIQLGVALGGGAGGRGGGGGAARSRGGRQRACRMRVSTDVELTYAGVSLRSGGSKGEQAAAREHGPGWLRGGALGGLALPRPSVFILARSAPLLASHIERLQLPTRFARLPAALACGSQPRNCTSSGEGAMEGCQAVARRLYDGAAPPPAVRRAHTHRVAARRRLPWPCHLTPPLLS